MTRFIVADVLDGLRELADESVQMIVTSPPYWRLRTYGVDGELGQEPTIAEYVANLVGVFDECRRVLKNDGTIWLNLGDSYNRKNKGKSGNTFPSHAINGGYDDALGWEPSLKHKDLCGIPWRVALALQDDGWWLRRDIIWSKPNPMPESAQDRPTSAHEYIFLLTKSERYFYDADAIRGPLKELACRRETATNGNSDTYHGGYPGEKQKKTDKQRGHSRRHAGFNDRWDVMTKAERCAMGANARSVWTFATRPYKGAHFATFPEELPRRCILAGSRPGDTVLDPFVGSGTTLVVAAKLGRHGIGIDLDARNEALFNERMRGVTPALEGIA